MAGRYYVVEWASHESGGEGPGQSQHDTHAPRGRGSSHPERGLSRGGQSNMTPSESPSLERYAMQIFVEIGAWPASFGLRIFLVVVPSFSLCRPSRLEVRRTDTCCVWFSRGAGEIRSLGRCNASFRKPPKEGSTLYMERGENGTFCTLPKKRVDLLFSGYIWTGDVPFRW